jgi:transcriptional regulator with XRE-family HTH domain
MTDMSASQLIRTARREAGLTQADLACRAGMPQSTIARLERPGANPTIAVLERALQAAGASLRLAPISTVDESQLAERLALSPAERLAAFQASHRNLRRLVGGARRVRTTA